MIICDGIALVCGALTLGGIAYRHRRERRDPLTRLRRGGLLDAAILMVAVGALLALSGSITASRARVPPLQLEQRLAGPAPAPVSEPELRRGLERLRRIAKPLAAPQPGEWRYHHKEPAQSFTAYLASNPITAHGERTIIYVQPIGPAQRRILELTAQFLRSYFCRPVQILRAIPLDVVPPAARRTQPGGAEQLLTGYVLEKVLRPRLPRDAVCLLGLTSTDLWPGRGWNFVFGQASLRDRVGVWSIHRMGNPDAGPSQFKTALLRTLKMAAHETGHMFSLPHCVRHHCLMNGSNSLPEADQQPLTLCPDCWAKLNWAGRCHPTARPEELERFLTRHGLEAEAARFRAERSELQRQ